MPLRMNTCDACQKAYVNKDGLKKHHERQPLCVQWMNLRPGVKDYVDQKFSLPRTEEEKGLDAIVCGICNKHFANVGNLNRHMESSKICSKWAMFKDLQSLDAYIDKEVVIYDTFEAPKYSICHILWNLYLVDKGYVQKVDDLRDVCAENKIDYILAILPSQSVFDSLVKFKIDHAVLEYGDTHAPSLDTDAFDLQIARIEALRAQRKNVLIFCNNGYQRSLPFLCHYLTRHHPDEAPNVERAVDLILPQVDRQNYATLRDEFVAKMKTLGIENKLNEGWIK